MDLYQDFKRVALFGMGMSGLDIELRKGILRYRGPALKWLFTDLGHGTDEVIRHLQKNASLEAFDGFIGHVGNDEVAALLASTGKPVVNLSGLCRRKEWDTHRFDDEAIGRMAGEYYLSMGHRNFVFFGPGQFDFSRARWRGFRNAVRERADLLVWFCNDNIEMFVPERKSVPIDSQVKKIMELPKPLAGFCAWDQQAVGTCDFLHFLVHVPEELALLGVDNNEVLCNMSVVPISSIALPAERRGYLAAEHLDCRLEGRALPAIKVLPPVRVVVRASTDLVAMEDSIVASAMALIRQHAAERMSIEEIADMLPISRRGFTDRFKNALGRSPRDELFRIRVEMAKERLMTTSQTVSWVASECGFSDAESMSAHFKKWVGVTPSAYRKGS